LTDKCKSCLRGVQKAKHILSIGKVSWETFEADSRTLDCRTDGSEEISINWEKDEEALKFTLSIFRNGCVRLTTQQIEEINKELIVINPLSYEDKPLNDNPYHGNLLIKSDNEPVLKRMIYSSLAMKASLIIR
jgi:hypothetical protein